MKNTIAIIGSGSVGSTSAYALILKKIAAHIILVDVDEARCRGEVLDLSDALSFCDGTNTITTGTFEQARNAGIIIISAGARQKPGQPRTELLATNKKVIEDIMGKLHPINPNAIIIMVSNPLDILTHQAWQLSGLPHTQVFGTGTFLDSKRLGSALAQQLGIAQESVHAYVLGEHGDSQFAAWSITRIDGVPFNSFKELTSATLNTIADQARNKAYEIIACKQATYYGIGTSVATICQAIIHNQKIVLPLSHFVKELGVCLSLPVILGAHGIEGALPITLNKQEQEQLQQSAQHIKKCM